MNKLILLLGILFSLSIFGEDKVELKFSIDTRFGLVSGEFQKSKLIIKDKKKKLATIEIDISSIDTKNGMRDKHLKNEDFFEIEKFPKAEFEIISLENETEDSLDGKAFLTIKGVKKEIGFKTTVQKNGDLEIYKGKININRKFFNINYDSSINPIKDIAILEFTITIQSK